MSAIYVYPREFERCVDLLTRKLEETAARAGVPDSECTDLEATLVALPPVARSRAEALLNGIQLQAADDFPAMAFAAKYVVKLAPPALGERASEHGGPGASRGRRLV